jgi:hypothetical protein
MGVYKLRLRSNISIAQIYILWIYDHIYALHQALYIGLPNLLCMNLQVIYDQIRFTSSIRLT